MRNPKYGNDRAVMFLASDDAGAKKIVTKLGENLGFEMIDNGNLPSSRMLESLAVLWIHPAFQGGSGRNFTLKLMRR